MKDPADKTCTITIHNVQGIELDAQMLHAAMRLVARHAPNAQIIDIYPSLREPADAPAWKFPGRIEWLVRVHYHGGGSLTIGLLQREPGAAFESHT